MLPALEMRRRKCLETLRACDPATSPTKFRQKQAAEDELAKIVADKFDFKRLKAREAELEASLKALNPFDDTGRMAIAEAQGRLAELAYLLSEDGLVAELREQRKNMEERR